MPTATVTIRELKNRESGLDLSIPSHKELSGLLGTTVEYHVVTVSRLHCFKSTTHKESDIVQFMVPKLLENFEDLKRKISLKFPGTVLPPLPKKGFTVLGDSHAKERRMQLEKFLGVLASNPNIALCPATLEFLGVNPITASNFRAESGLPPSDHTDIFEESARGNDKLSPQDDLFGDLDEEEQDLFGGFGEKKSDFTSELSLPTDDGGRLFVLSPDAPSAAATKLFGDQDLGGAVTKEEQSLFLVAGATDDDHHKALTPKIEDNSDLLNIEDDLDQLLNITKKPPKAKKPDLKPKLAAKPTSPTSRDKPTLAVKPMLSGKPKPSPKPKPAVGPTSPISGDKPAIPSKPKPGPKPTSPTSIDKPVLAPKPGSKPALKAKPDLPKKQEDLVMKKDKDSDVDDLFSLETDLSVGGDIGADDILRYIQDNSQAQTDDLDLFS